ncbi:MAG TPA: 50S ribosomal protein L25 [Cyanobacteria bacterium UBA8803]|nr:50S ribosomal protein L25 [Cyanobacteria bacterium UBA8803]
MELTVECQKRPEGSKPKALRRAGIIPATLYGHKGAESVALTVNAKTAETLLKKAAVNNSLIQVNIPDLPWSGKALLREVQTHPWKNSLYHISFFSVAAHDTIEVVVPLNLVGQAAGVKSGGVLERLITELKVECAPDRIPESIDVDISNLQIGENLHIHQLVLPEGITVKEDPEKTVLTIVAPASGVVEEEITEEPA